MVRYSSRDPIHPLPQNRISLLRASVMENGTKARISCGCRVVFKRSQIRGLWLAKGDPASAYKYQFPLSPQAQLLLSLRLGLGLHLQQVGDAGPTDRRARQAPLGSSGSRGASGRSLTPPPERRIYPAALRRLTGLPDESGVPIGMAARLGGGVGLRPYREFPIRSQPDSTTGTPDLSGSPSTARRPAG